MHLIDTQTLEQTHATDQAKADLQKAIDNIAAKEAECFRTIHARYCILNHIAINVSDVGRYQPDKRLRPNYWEYWLRWETKEQAFLMSREVYIENGEIKLDVTFRKDLIREGE